jgi:hypothetical protein
MDRPSGRVIRRYQPAAPGELVHVDVKKLGRLLPGGGHRVHGRDSAQHRTRDRQRRPGWDVVHAAVEDHSRLAYVEVLADEQAPRPAPGSCAAPALGSPATASASSGS